MKYRNRVVVAFLLVSIACARIASAQAVVTRLPGPLPPCQPNNDSCVASLLGEMGISGDGRYVVYESRATNLVPGISTVYNRIYLFDSTTQKTICVTPGAVGCSDPTISANGRFIVFASSDPNLVSNDTNGCVDIFLVDRDIDGNGIFDEQPYLYERINLDSSGHETHGNAAAPSISDDGSRVLFQSMASDLVPNDKNASWDAFLRDRSAGTTTRVDVSTAGVEANVGCDECDLSGDGKTVVFTSNSSNLVAGDKNNANDVFLRDLIAGTTSRISFGINGQESDGNSFVIPHSVSRDGMRVAFYSDADNLDSRDGRGGSDVFVYDRNQSTITMVDFNSSGFQADGDCGAATISADGTRVAFSGWADNLTSGDTNYGYDVFVRDTVAATTTCLSTAASGGTGDGESASVVLDSDGTKAAFSSFADNIVDNGWRGGFRSVYFSDLGAATVQYVSDVAAGEPNGPSVVGGFPWSGDSTSISADGRWVAFESAASNLVGYDGNGATDVFVADRSTGAVTRISVAFDGSEANGYSELPAISADGRFVTFDSVATNLVPNDQNGPVKDVFRVDRDPDGNGVFDEGNSQIILVSVDSNGAQLAYDSLRPAISADGNRIAFEMSDFAVGFFSVVYVRDVSMATLDLCYDPSSGPYGVAFNASISGDGTTVVLESRESTGIGNHVWGYSTRKQSSNKIALICASGYPSRYSVSYDGSRVAYWESLSSGTNPIRVASIDWSNGGTVSGVSDPLYPPPYEEFGEPSLSQDGNVITVSSPDSLIPGDTNGAWDLYLSTLENDIYGNPGTFTEPVLVDVSVAGSWPTGSSDFPSTSADAYSIAFASDAPDLVNNDTNRTRDVFVSDMTGVASTRFYGRGYPNSSAIIPRLSMTPAPVLGSPVTLSLDNSSGIDTSALLIVSAKRADVTLNYGATILVDLSIGAKLMVSVPAAGLSIPSTISNDPSLSGISAYLQAIEIDSTAPHHLTFSNGLDVHFGH